MSMVLAVYFRTCSLCVLMCVSVGGAETFRYTNQGGEDSIQIPGTDDVVDLERTRNAFTILGIQLLY